MEELRNSWPIVVSIFAALAVIVRYFYAWRQEYDLHKAKQDGFENTTKAYLEGRRLHDDQKETRLNNAIAEVEKKNEEAIERLQLKTENSILRNKEETSSRLEKLFSKIETMNESVIKMTGNYDHIAKTMDEIKRIQIDNAKFREDFYREQGRPRGK